LGVWLIGSGWWYVRNKALYGSFFIHTPGKYGTGLDLGAKTGLLPALRFTLTETYLSTWVQRGWFPEGIAPLLYGVIVIVCVFAAVGWLKRGRGPDAACIAQPGSKSAAAKSCRPTEGTASSVSRFHVLAALALLVMLLIGQQVAFWTEDVELNAGGRYMLIALPAIALLLVEGIRRLGPRLSRVVLPIWVIALLVFNVASAYNITNTLVPRYFPEWRMFEFPTGSEP
jgi:hypothetical protein